MIYWRTDPMSTTEAQTCGRRMTEFGPWTHEEGLDTWRPGNERWETDPEAAVRKKAEYEAAHPGSTASGYAWTGPGDPPRTCSFCGGAHPDDVIALIEAGWEVEGTTKGYKRYLQPPGYRAAMDAWGKDVRQGPPAISSPAPPVKVYVQHFTPAQVDRFNTALAIESVTRPHA